MHTSEGQCGVDLPFSATVYLRVFGALGVVSGVEHLKAAHVTHITVEVGTVDSVAAFSNSSVWAELLPQLFIWCITVKLLNERDSALHLY